MKHSTKLLVIIATAVSTLAFAAAGWALWSTTGTGSASQKAAALAAPTALTVSSPSSGTVAVGWTASSTASPNATPTGYYVQRLGGTPSTAPACGTSAASLTTTTSCSDTGVSGGTYTYKVTAVLQSWTAQSGASGSVTVSADTTAPTLVTGSLQMLDTNANGKVDHVTATFSETLASSTLTSQWTLANVPSGGTLSSVSTSGTVATLTLNEGTNPANTAVGSFTLALTANAAGIRDSSGNQSSFTATAPVDKAAPALTTLQMLDSNSNGKVDQVQATFSETLASSIATAPWTLTNVPSGGSLLSVATSGTIATLTLTEGGSPADTSVGSFRVALATSATGIRDTATSANLSSFLATAPVDLSKPVLVTATSGAGATAGLMQEGDALVLTFSEPLDPALVPTSALVKEQRGGSSTLTIPGVIVSTSIANGYLGGNPSTGSATGTIVLSNGNKTITITVGAITTTGGGVTTGSGSVNVTPDAAIVDLQGNGSASTAASVSRLF